MLSGHPGDQPVAVWVVQVELARLSNRRGVARRVYPRSDGIGVGRWSSSIGLFHPVTVISLVSNRFNWIGLSSASFGIFGGENEEKGPIVLTSEEHEALEIALGEIAVISRELRDDGAASIVECSPE